MNSITHPVAPEEVMALVDGELPAAEARAVAAHIEECAECAALRDEIHGTSEALRAWSAPEFSAEAIRAVEVEIVRADSKSKADKPRSYTPLSFRNWRLWAIGGGGAAFGIVVLVTAVAIAINRPVSSRMMMYSRPDSAEPEQDKDVTFSLRPTQQDTSSAAHPSPQSGGGGGGYRQQAGAGVAGMDSMPLAANSAGKLVQVQPGIVGGAAPSRSTVEPMIARSVAITVLVRNIEDARKDLDSILTRRDGYAAQLTVNTPENGARSFQSSLRIPARELATVLGELRSLGRVQTETQSGEEVTRQHTDLVARLTNARETETRLRTILQQRTGKMEDVLDVEEKISETRGEIEQMEAEQKELEHRVSFARVELQLAEQYKAQLGGGAPQSVGMEMHNALVAGLRNAGGSLLGLVLFFEEYGPSLLLWTVLLGGPVWLVWRVRRRKRLG